jgi:hypothetical protein
MSLENVSLQAKTSETRNASKVQKANVLRFNDWQEHDEASYSAKCIGYLKGAKLWFVSEVVDMERLGNLAKGLPLVR